MLFAHGDPECGPDYGSFGTFPLNARTDERGKALPCVSQGQYRHAFASAVERYVHEYGLKAPRFWSFSAAICGLDGEIARFEIHD